MKFLIAGLGNPGAEYAHTRHNIGFLVLDALAQEAGVAWESVRYGHVARIKVAGRVLVLLKPNTYMNLSGSAVRYWLQDEKLDKDKLLVVTDDLALPFGKLRLKAKGSAGGHNGLKHIEALLNTQEYARLRFGIGASFGQGQQVDYVLANFDAQERETLQERIEAAGAGIKSFATRGLGLTMTEVNR